MRAGFDGWDGWIDWFVEVELGIVLGFVICMEGVGEGALDVETFSSVEDTGMEEATLVMESDATYGAGEWLIGLVYAKEVGEGNAKGKCVS